MPADALAYLLDMAPRVWSTREELQLRLCLELRKHSFNPIIAYSEEPPPEIRAAFERIGTRVFALRYQDSAAAYWRGIRRIMKPYRFRLAHVRFFSYADGIHWVAKLAGAEKVLFTEANSGDFPSRQFWKRPLLSWRRAVTCYPVDHLIAISEFIRQRLVECGFPSDKINVVYNGVDTERFAPRPASREELRARLGVAEDELLIAGMAVLLPYKRVDVLIRATGILNHERGVPARLVWGGEGPLRQDLEELARECGVSDRVHLVGHVPNAEWYYQGSDVFALSSVGEAFGNVLAEAMACGTPVVASRDGAICEIVEDGVCGLLAEACDPRSFAQALERLARDASLRRRLGEAGRKRVVERFSVDVAVAETMKVYEKLW